MASAKVGDKAISVLTIWVSQKAENQYVSAWICDRTVDNPESHVGSIAATLDESSPGMQQVVPPKPAMVLSPPGENLFHFE